MQHAILVLTRVCTHRRAPTPVLMPTVNGATDEARRRHSRNAARHFHPLHCYSMRHGWYGTGPIHPTTPTTAARPRPRRNALQCVASPKSKWRVPTDETARASPRPRTHTGTPERSCPYRVLRVLTHRRPCPRRRRSSSRPIPRGGRRTPPRPWPLCRRSATPPARAVGVLRVPNRGTPRTHGGYSEDSRALQVLTGYSEYSPASATGRRRPGCSRGTPGTLHRRASTSGSAQALRFSRSSRS